jgi:hypothetical protein
MPRNHGRRNARPLKLTLLPAEAFGPAAAPLVASAVHRDDPTLRRAAAWLVRRHRVSPALAATVAAHAGLGALGGAMADRPTTLASSAAQCAEPDQLTVPARTPGR